MAKQPTLAQKLGAEVLGTALLTLIGAGSVTATITLDGSVPFSEAQLGVISFAFAFIIMALVYTIGKVSGCQINPAISIALSLTGRQNWADTAMYVVAQFVGGILGALGIVALFGTTAATHSILGVTSYADSTPVIQALFAEAIGTFILVFTVYGIAVDPRAPAGWAGLVIGLIVAGIIFVVGPVTGSSLNPARSFGPVLIQALFGGKAYFDQYWVYVVGPVVGGALGAFAYDFLASPKAAATAEAPVEAEKVRA
ncbi:MAG TPA: MIP/aquaporin family protein [Ktedonobacterales bacterium]|nr:MIP/aquaporin family protein [Ktedonobacterales bacterium]